MTRQPWTAQDLAEKGYREVLGKWGKGGVVGRDSQLLSGEQKLRRGSLGNRGPDGRSVAGSNPAPSLSQSVFIPGPLPGMNDIVRKNHYVYSAMKQQWGRTIAVCLAHAKLRPMTRVTVQFQWVERNTRRDPDNILAGGQKLVLDCLVTAGLLPDDGWANIAGLTHAFQIDASNPGVWVTLEEESA